MGFWSDLTKSVMQGIGDGLEGSTSSGGRPCPECGTEMPDEWGGDRFECPNFHGPFFLIDGELLTPDQRRDRRPADRCQSCQQSLAGGTSYMPWENGSNSYAYVICPSCGSENIYDGMGGD